MLLIDSELKNKGSQFLEPFAPQKVQAIGYDLEVKTFFTKKGTESTEVELKPMDSVFVESVEQISLPADMTASVVLRNSRIRQGLMLAAPVYYPGHKTPVYFRITNISSQIISLKQGDGLATIMFDRLNEEVAAPYEGAFQHEVQYKGMASYTDVYESAMKEVEKKVDLVKDLEKSIYGNVLAIMAIFVAAFSLININISLAKDFLDLRSFIVFNACTVGSIAFLVAVTQKLLAKGTGNCLFIASAVAFVVAGLSAYIH